MAISKITEGKAQITAHTDKESAISKSAPVFYNPKMKHNRDISVLALTEFQEETKRTLKIADCFAATGIRGIRYALEVPNVSEVFFSDLNPSAIKFIEKNIKLNKIRCAQIEKKDVNVFLSEHKYEIDFVDIDPFGSPIQFLDSAARAVSNKGMLGITATDTAPLSGTYTRACMRKYSAKPLRCGMQHELGIRILIANIARECAKYEKGFIPLVSFAELHYFRVFGKIKKSRSYADNAMQNTGYFVFCKNCGHSAYLKDNCKKECENCGEKTDFAGPLWIGKIFDSDFCDKIYEKSKAMDDKALEKLLATICDESVIEHPWHEIGFLASVFGCETPKISVFIEKLHKAGFRASRTHFSSTGVRTDATVKEIKKVLN